MKTARSIRALGAAVVVGMALTACGGTSSSGNGATSGGEADTSATMSLGVFSVPTSFDPALIRVPYASDAQFLSPVYDQLLSLDDDLKIAPGLASAWEVSDDGRTLTLTLRTDVTFQDGSGFDSAVVKANLDRAKTLRGSTAASVLGQVSQVVTDGPDKVRIEFTEPSFSFPYVMASNYGVSSMVSGQALASGADLSRTPAGSGPYTLTNYGQDRATFTRDDDYWNKDELPALREATLIGMPDDNARLSALQSGQVQVAAIRPNQNAAYTSLVSSGQFQQVPFPGQTFTLLLNNTRPGLDNVRVRKALSLAIDREAINDALLNGQAPAAYQFQTEGMPGYVASINDEDHYDPEQARKLLTEAGAENLELNLILNSTNPSDSIATVLQDQLAKVGVTVKFKQYTPVESGPAWRKGEADGYTVGVLLGGDPSLFLDQYLFGSYTLGEVAPAVTAAYQKAMGLQLDDPKRTEALEELSLRLDETPIHIPVVRVPSQYLASNDVIGLEKMSFSQMGSMPEIRVLGRTG